MDRASKRGRLNGFSLPHQTHRRHGDSPCPTADTGHRELCTPFPGLQMPLGLVATSRPQPPCPDQGTLRAPPPSMSPCSAQRPARRCKDPAASEPPPEPTCLSDAAPRPGALLPAHAPGLILCNDGTLSLHRPRADSVTEKPDTLRNLSWRRYVWPGGHHPESSEVHVALGRRSRALSLCSLPRALGTRTRRRGRLSTAQVRRQTAGSVPHRGARVLPTPTPEAPLGLSAHLCRCTRSG